MTVHVRLVWLLGLSLVLFLGGCGPSASSSSKTAVSPPDATATSAPTSLPVTATETPLPASPVTAESTSTSALGDAAEEPNNKGDYPLVCLTASGEVSLPDVVDSVRAALAQIQNQHPDWEAAIGEAATLHTDGACEVDLPNRPLNRQRPIGPGGNEERTPWHTVIVLLDDARAQAILGDVTAEVVPYQQVPINDHEIAFVNNALVARASSLRGPEFLRELTFALALDPARLPSN